MDKELLNTYMEVNDLMKYVGYCRNTLQDIKRYINTA